MVHSTVCDVMYVAISLIYDGLARHIEEWVKEFMDTFLLYKKLGVKIFVVWL